MLRIRGLLAALLCLVLVGAAVAQDKKDVKPDIDKEKEKENRAKIIGPWVLVKGREINLTVEFTNEDKITVKADENGKATVLEGTYRIDGDRLIVTTKVEGGRERTEADIIKTLTADKLLLDDHGKEIEFKRTLEKKPIPK